MFRAKSRIESVQPQTLRVLAGVRAWVRRKGFGMTQNPHRIVVRFEERPNLCPSRSLFPIVYSAHLECGHIIEMGVRGDRPKRMACYECSIPGRSWRANDKLR